MASAPFTVAITGGTGFVGGRLLDAAQQRGWRIRALTRRVQPARENISWVPGALDDPTALANLCEGADAVIHVAGVVNAPDRAGFDQGNVVGTQNMVTAAQSAGVGRFVHVSSLAATQPELSLYGDSKARAEPPVTESGLNWSIVRPPAIYGPGDGEMLDLFKMAVRGIIMLPPDTSARLSVIHVDDLVRLLIALTESEGANGAIYECDDGQAGGWTHAEFARAIGTAVGKKVRPVGTPRPLLRLTAFADGLLRGKSAKLTPDRVRYFCHPDWTIDPAKRPPTGLWQAAIATPDGLTETAKWYREQGWLK